MPSSDKFQRVKDAIRHRIPDLVSAWLPAGKQQGNYWVAGDVRGGPGTSFHVSLVDGHFVDHADPAVKGGDIISLCALIRSISQSDAADQLERECMAITTRPRKIINTTEVIAVPAPDGCDLPRHDHGDRVYQYRDASGKLLFVVIRTPSKKIFQFVWDSKRGGWAPGGWPEAKPLYRTPALVANPSLPVVVVEGEKCADVGQGFFGSSAYVVVSWAGGATAWHKSDWSLLVGRKVFIWPDNDMPGTQAGVGIAKLLASLGCTSVTIVQPPDGKPSGWDVADAVSEGFDLSDFTTMKTHQFGASVIEVAGAEVTRVTTSECRAQLELSRSGEPRSSVANAVQIFTDDPEFTGSVYFDSFYGRKRKADGSPWSDQDSVRVLIEIQRAYKMHSLSLEKLQTAIEGYAAQKTISSPAEWMKSLEWDGKPRIANLFHEYFGAENSEYVRAASHNFMVSMAARILQPGCKVDTMPVLEGKQGKRKSTALMALAGNDWHCDQVADVNDKDFFQALQGKMIVEIAELDSFKRGDVTRIKQVLTIQIDHYRPSYGHEVLDRPRQCVFVGTTNKDDYLVDETGNRRFWPIVTGNINLDAIKRDREQLFAEAVDRFNNGSTWWEMPTQATEEMQASRVSDDSWTGEIINFMSTRTQATTAVILSMALEIEIGRQTKFDQMRVATIMKRLGYVQGRQGNGDRVRIWKLP